MALIITIGTISIVLGAYFGKAIIKNISKVLVERVAEYYFPSKVKLRKEGASQPCSKKGSGMFRRWLLA